MDFGQLCSDILIPILFFCGGLVLIANGLYGLWLGYKSEYWPQVSGEVLSSSLNTSRWPDGDVSYRSKVEYLYTVNSVEYQSTTVFFGENVLLGGKSARGRVEKYSSQKEIIVFHDPKNPQVSVLEPGVHIEVIVELGTGIILLAVSMAVIF